MLIGSPPYHPRRQTPRQLGQEGAPITTPPSGTARRPGPPRMDYSGTVQAGPTIVVPAPTPPPFAGSLSASADSRDNTFGQRLPGLREQPGLPGSDGGLAKPLCVEAVHLDHGVLFAGG